MPRDYARRVTAQFCELANDEILRVVAGHGDERVGPAAPGFHLRAALVRGRVHHDRAELLLDEISPTAIGLDDCDLVAGLEERLRKMESDLARARHNEIHLFIGP